MFSFLSVSTLASSFIDFSASTLASFIDFSASTSASFTLASFTLALFIDFLLHLFLLLVLRTQNLMHLMVSVNIHRLFLNNLDLTIER